MTSESKKAQLAKLNTMTSDELVEIVVGATYLLDQRLRNASELSAHGGRRPGKVIRSSVLGKLGRAR